MRPPEDALSPRAAAAAARAGRLQPLIYWFIFWFVSLAETLVFRVRYYGVDRIPRRGACLFVANHQSYLDPPVIGTVIRTRQFHPVARLGLFENPRFGWFIRTLNSIPIKEESGDMAAIREALSRLDDGHPVLLFPEGSRTPDGLMRPFKRGAWILFKRSQCPVVPVAIEGAFDAWPRRRKRPRFWARRLAVMIGEPVSHDELIAMGEQEGLRYLAARIDDMRAMLRRRINAANGGRPSRPRGAGR